MLEMDTIIVNRFVVVQILSAGHTKCAVRAALMLSKFVLVL